MKGSLHELLSYPLILESPVHDQGFYFSNIIGMDFTYAISNGIIPSGIICDIGFDQRPFDFSIISFFRVLKVFIDRPQKRKATALYHDGSIRSKVLRGCQLARNRLLHNGLQTLGSLLFVCSSYIKRLACINGVTVVWLETRS